ncbi:hypothetical protein [Bifidobacterium parmae]|uniref:Histidine kinase A n=1 Tax=Bifidobacterium parmae TaxID=361854 RepID=A0A2N5J6H0_9BIFI|nr:hypothetical protein [Bifidobacterium parmae]PLS29812.1 histidine kinase A [Bifidobacterium parmae]
MSILLMGAGTGLLVAVSLTFILAFNMSRFRWIMDHDIHPLLEEHGLRKPDDGFESSGIKERMDAFHADVAEALAAPEREREARERRQSITFDPMVDESPLPAGPYPFNRPTASWARDIYEEGDWTYAAAWVKGRRKPRVVREQRYDSWRNELLARHGLTDASPATLTRIEHAATRIRILRHTSQAEAYQQACRKTAIADKR